MSKFSSFKEHQLITESWRRYINEDNGEEGEAAEASPEDVVVPSGEDVVQILDDPRATAAADELLAQLPPEVLAKIDAVLAAAPPPPSAPEGELQEDLSDPAPEWLEKYILNGENLWGMMWTGLGGLPFGALTGEQVIKALSTGPLAEYAQTLGYAAGGAVAVASFVAAVLHWRRAMKKFDDSEAAARAAQAAQAEEPQY
jgi:hypothetical protein